MVRIEQLINEKITLVADDLLEIANSETLEGGNPRSDKTKISSIVNASKAIKLDDFSTPDDNTDLDVSTSAHGLAPKLPNVVTEFLNGQGGYTTPAGAGIDTTALHDNVAAEIVAIAEKVTPVGADHVVMEDSENLNNKKRIQIVNLLKLVTGFEQITEGGNTGWALKGDNRVNKGDIGVSAIDMSTSSGASSTRGATGDYSNASGYNTTASNILSIADGENCISSGEASHASGANSVASGNSSFATGAYNTSSGEGSHTKGNACEAAGQWSNASGMSAVTEYFGSSALAAGRFSVVGDAQTRELPLMAYTTDDTANVVMGANNTTENTNASNLVVVKANQVMSFVAHITAKTDNHTTMEHVRYKITGGITRDNSNNTVLDSSLMVETLHEHVNLTGCSVDAVSDDTNEALQIRVTGIAATNLRWMCRLETEEVIY